MCEEDPNLIAEGYYEFFLTLSIKKSLRRVAIFPDMVVYSASPHFSKVGDKDFFQQAFLFMRFHRFFAVVS